jgi:hypothetical protein
VDRIHQYFSAIKVYKKLHHFDEFDPRHTNRKSSKLNNERCSGSPRTPDVLKTPIPVYRTNEIPLHSTGSPSHTPDPHTPDPHTLDPHTPDPHTPDPRI